MHRHLLDLFDLRQVVDTLLAVADKRDQQARHHAQGRNAHGVGHVDAADVHAAAGDVGQQDLIEEDVAEAHRQEHVGRDQAEGHDAGDQSTVQLQLGQHVEKRRHQQRNERDMDRQDVLRGDGHDPEQANQQPLDLATAAGVLAIDHGQGLVGQRMGHAGLGNGHGESTEQSVGQSHRRPAAEAAVKSLERRLDTQATGQTTYQRTDDQGDHHMHAGQAEDQHDADRGNDCIHFVTS
ncbi:hypothetical protein D3C86_1114190 [compost metagenome]